MSLICQVSCKIIYNVNSDNRIKQIGRYDNNRAEWSYTGIHIQVASSSLLPMHININTNNTDDYNYYINVLINCEIYHEYNVNNDNSTIGISINDHTTSSSIYNIAIVKVTESKYVDSYGYVDFDTIDIIGGDLIDTNQIYPSYCTTTTTSSNDNTISTTTAITNCFISNNLLLILKSSYPM